MSYSKAWKLMNTLEKRLGFKLFKARGGEQLWRRFLSYRGSPGADA